MQPVDSQVRAGLQALRTAVLATLRVPLVETLHLDTARLCSCTASDSPTGASVDWLLAEAAAGNAPLDPPSPAFSTRVTPGPDPADPPDERLTALVDLARDGDSDAFGQLYDHYVTTVYRFLYYRVGSQPLAEDLTSETFFRALRAIGAFRWQGKDFGAWLVTIARNLVADHYKSGRYRLEVSTDQILHHDTPTHGLEDDVLTSMSNEALLDGVRQLPPEQQECLVLRFLQGMSIAETAKALGRSEGAVKQLQLRAVRKLAKVLPEGLR